MDERRPSRVLRAVRGVAPKPRYKSSNDLTMTPRRQASWSSRCCQQSTEVPLIGGIMMSCPRLEANLETEGVENQPNVAQQKNSRLRSRLSKTTLAAPFGHSLDCSTCNNPDRSTQCSSCHIAAFQMRSSMFLSQESHSSKSARSVRTLCDER